MVSTQRSLSLAVEAKDPAISLTRINLYVNDIPIHGRWGIPLPRGVNEWAGRVDVTLSTGGNKIQISTTNANGDESLRDTINIHYSPSENPKRDLYIVAVGVSDYSDDALDLAAAAKDAEDLGAFFKRTRADDFGEIHIHTILDKAATRKKILESSAFLKQSGVDDQVIVFVAGHGFVEQTDFDYYFGTTNIDYRDLPKYGLRYDELEGLFDGILARERLLLMDTCFAGEIDADEIEIVTNDPKLARGVIPRAPAFAGVPHKSKHSLGNLMQQLFSDFRRRTGATVISASGGMEFVFAEERQQGDNHWCKPNLHKSLIINTN